MNTDPNFAGYDDPLSGAPASARDQAAAAAVPASAAPELKSLLGVIVATLVVSALYFGKEVLVPITLAVMLSFVLSPLVNLLQRLRLWRAPAMILSVLVALGSLGLVGTLIGSQVASLSQDAPTYARTIGAKVESVQGFAATRLASLAKSVGGKHAPGAAATRPAAVPQTTPAGERVLPVKVIPEATSPVAVARTVLAPMLRWSGLNPRLRGWGWRRELSASGPGS